MKLINNEIIKRFERDNDQQELGMDSVVDIKYFNPTGVGTWLVTDLVEIRISKGKEYDALPQSSHLTSDMADKISDGWSVDDVIFWCYASLGYEWEWGTTSLKELTQFRGQFGLGIERDLHCKNMTVKQLIN